MRRVVAAKALVVLLTAVVAGVLWSPAAPAHATGVTAIGAGDTFTCAVSASAHVLCWGATNWYPDVDPHPRPEPLLDESSAPLDDAAAVVGGSMHGCALTTAGGVQCWGWPRGDGTGVGGADAVDVLGLGSGVTAISAGWIDTCAVTTGGSVACWVETPAMVSGLESGAINVAVGRTHRCALMAVGTVKCWGDNFAGQLGDGTTTDRLAPVDVVDGQGGILTGVTGIATGFWHTCASMAAGGVKCWGDNYSGQLGNGAIGGSSPTPVNVQGVAAPVVDLSVSAVNSCAVVVSGDVRCWGDNSHGQLGASAQEACPDPLKGASFPVSCSSVGLSVQGLMAQGVDVAVAAEHICVLLITGAVQCVGRNSYGQLGNGTTTDSLTPVDVLFDSDDDACPDPREQGADPLMGGARNPKDFWDFFDTPDAAKSRDGAVTAGDLGRIVARFGATGDPGIDPRSAPLAAPAYHTAFDRSPPAPGADLWDAGPPDGSIVVGDIGAVVAQFGHSCV